MEKRIRKGSFTDLCLYIVTAELIGALSAIASGDGYSTYYSSLTKPPFSPPGWVFPLAWAVLYALMGIFAYLISLSDHPEAKGTLRLYHVQLFVNFLWSPVFFRAKSFPGATALVFVLLGLLLAMTVRAFRVRKAAGFVLLPYLLWTAYAAYLTIGFWLNN